MQQPISGPFTGHDISGEKTVTPWIETSQEVTNYKVFLDQFVSSFQTWAMWLKRHAIQIPTLQTTYDPHQCPVVERGTLYLECLCYLWEMCAKLSLGNYPLCTCRPFVSSTPHQTFIKSCVESRKAKLVWSFRGCSVKGREGRTNSCHLRADQTGDGISPGQKQRLENPLMWECLGSSQHFRPITICPYLLVGRFTAKACTACFTGGRTLSYGGTRGSLLTRIQSEG